MNHQTDTSVDPVGAILDQILRQTQGSSEPVANPDEKLWQELHDLLSKLPPATSAAPKVTPVTVSKPSPAPVPRPSPAPTPKAATYTVKGGDSLSAIAANTLGNSDRWREIYDLNRSTIGSNPDMIQPGEVLTLPGGASSPAPAPIATAHGHGNAPYINQYHPGGSPYWNGPSNCGPTSMAMVARAYGWNDGLNNAQLINKLGSIGGTTANGTDLGGITAMAHAIGIGAQEKTGGADTQWIASQLKAGKYVVANIDYFAEPGHGSGHSGHYILVTGVTADGHFTIQDPADASEQSWTAGQLAYAINRQYGDAVAVG